MRLLPAIDIRGGRCVRLRRGDFADETVFADDPVEVARRWVEGGASYLHVVDLDGARAGVPRNFALVKEIADSVPATVQTGGGIRSHESLELVAGSRVAKAVLGTSAVEDAAFLEHALAILGPERLVVAVDAEKGFVKTRGWLEKSDVRVLDLVRRLKGMGVREILYTDISRDGMMQSVDLGGIREVAESSGLEVIASGGVTSLDDLRALKELEPVGVTGVIAGRALYEGRFTVEEALAVLETRREGSAGPFGDGGRAEAGRGRSSAGAGTD